MGKNNDEQNDARAVEADTARRESAGAPFKIAQALAKRQADLNRKKRAKK